MESFLIFWAMLWLLIFATWGLWSVCAYATRKRPQVEKPPPPPRQEDPWQVAKKAYQEAMRQIDNSALLPDEKETAKQAAREQYARAMKNIMDLR